MPRRLHALLLCCLLAGPMANAETLRLSNGEWAPYLGQQLPGHGVVSRIIEDALAREGLQVEWQFLPWPRALKLAEQNRVDGTAVWARTARRDALFLASEPVMRDRYVIFHRSAQPFDWQQISDLAGWRIGAAQDYVYGSAFEQAEDSGLISVTRLNSEAQALRMLLGGRIDLLPMDVRVARSLLDSQFSAAERAQLSHHPRTLRSETLHLLLPRANPRSAERLRRFNRGLQSLQADGSLQRYWQALESEATPPLSP